jgi:hypothetical protein
VRQIHCDSVFLGRVDEFSTDDVFGIPEVNQT